MHRDHEKSTFDWFCRSTWKTSAKNTLVCLIGCMSGDYSALYLLHDYSSRISIWGVMVIAMACGLITSVALETLILLGQMRLKKALTTALGMSVVSMLMMELSANLMAIGLNQGQRLVWWVILPSLVAGFLAAWPYNYYRLRRYGLACH